MNRRYWRRNLTALHGISRVTQAKTKLLRLKAVFTSPELNYSSDGWSSNDLQKNLIIFDRAVMIYRIMNGLCPDNLRGRLVTRSQISNKRSVRS